MRGPNPKAVKRDQQRLRLVELWLDRPKDQRTDDDLLRFYGWLSEHAPDLIPPAESGAGTYQQLRTLLSNHIIERSR